MKTAMKELQDALEIYSRHNKGTQEGKEIDIILSTFPKFIEAESRTFDKKRVKIFVKN